MIIFRNDDVNPNSNFEDIKKIYAIIKKYFPDAQIYSCVNLFVESDGDSITHAYKQNETLGFLKSDKMFDLKNLEGLENVVSHGMWHWTHKGHLPLQEASILTSCKVLNTNTFIPPFWQWDLNTEVVCKRHNIKLWVNEDWRNIERKDITNETDYYLFHSWRFTPESFEERLKTIIKR